MLENFENHFQNKIREIATNDDPAHDILHFQRVVKMAKYLCEKENGKREVVVPAAWLHDLVIIPKSDPRRSQASRLSAEAALEFLSEIKYPKEYYSDIAHAIEGHSFSANIKTQTLEANIVQDADRLDGLGVIGIARCFATAGLLKRAFYFEEDPFCFNRPPDDSKATIDHFYAKLFKVIETLKTPTAQIEGQRRGEIMKRFLEDLKSEILPSEEEM